MNHFVACRLLIRIVRSPGRPQLLMGVFPEECYNK